MVFSYLVFFFTFCFIYLLFIYYLLLFTIQGEGVSYRGRLLMAVQAETGESASESGIRQVEVEPTAPISEVRLITLFLVGLGDLVSLDLSPKGLGKISLTKYLWENISEKISLRKYL